LSYEIKPIAEQIKTLSGGLKQLLEEMEYVIPLVEEYTEDDEAEYYLNGFTYGAEHSLKNLGHIMTELVRTRMRYVEWSVIKSQCISHKIRDCGKVKCVNEKKYLVEAISNMPMEVFQETAVRSEGTPSVVCI